MRLARLIGLAALVALVIAPAALALRFSDDSYFTPTGVVGKPYKHQFKGEGGCGPGPGAAGLPYQFRLLSGSLPPGLTLNRDGLLSGTPTQAGGWSFWVELSDENPPSAGWCVPKTAEREFVVRIEPGLTIQQAQFSVPPATVGQAYGPIQFTAAGGGTQTWSALQIPAGLTLSPSGLLSGTPTVKSGDSKLTVLVKDPSGRDHQVTYNLPVRDQLLLNAQPTPPAEVGRPFTVGFAATGGNEAYTWETSTLPAGLTFDQARRALVGAPTAPGTFAVKVTAKDTEGRAASKDVSIVVAPKLAITTRTLRAGKVGKAYAVRFKLRGGVGPIQWRLIRFRPGAKGLRFDRTTGTLRFRPGVARRYTIIVRATDSLKAVSTQTLTLRVKA
jgi:hypothetical protein